jgi:AcrR family transcriptional regulator
VRIPKSTDRRVRRTRRALRDSLLALTLERGWDEVNVLDVCERADVARSTFYTHFADKEELLLSGFDDLRAALRAKTDQEGRGAPTVLGFLGGLIEHARENAKLFRALIGKRAGQVAQKGFRQFVFDRVREDLLAAYPGDPGVEAAARYVSGGISDVLMWSVDSRSPLRSADLDELCMNLTRPVLATLGRSRR